jgi:hypothetical protein
MVEDRSNECVACGGQDHLTVHHVGKITKRDIGLFVFEPISSIVPEMYRHWMPLVIKSKSVIINHLLHLKQLQTITFYILYIYIEQRSTVTLQALPRQLRR